MSRNLRPDSAETFRAPRSKPRAVLILALSTTMMNDSPITVEIEADRFNNADQIVRYQPDPSSFVLAVIPRVSVIRPGAAPVAHCVISTMPYTRGASPLYLGCILQGSAGIIIWDLPSEQGKQ